MNERIEELWDKAAEDTMDYSWESQTKFMERFAELIVRECMTICKNHPSRIVSNNWNADAVAPHLVQQFEEHFGVEE